MANDPFHEGERFVQETVGERDQALLNGGLMDDKLPLPAAGFVRQQELMVLGWADRDGDLWAHVLTGPKGFAEPDESLKTVAVALKDATGVLSLSPPFDGLAVGDPLGGLFIELGTRRRLRINGRVAELTGGQLLFAVEQAYPNCPKYIQRRTVEETTAPTDAHAETDRGDGLTENLRSWITGADTFFVASAHPDGPVDINHRGGAPGFVTIDGGTLRIPDYPGNSMFNTFGNLHLNPRAGLCFLDFERSRLLKLTGEAELYLDAGDDDGETGGTGRWWSFTPQRWIATPLNHPLQWRFVDASPFNPLPPETAAS